MTIEEMKAAKVKAEARAAKLRTEANGLENTAKELQTEIEKATFNGMTFYQYMESLRGTVKQVNGYSVVYRGHDLLVDHTADDGVRYQMNELIYHDNSHIRFWVTFPSSRSEHGITKSYYGRNSVPARHVKVYDDMVAATAACKIVKP